MKKMNEDAKHPKAQSNHPRHMTGGKMTQKDDRSAESTPNTSNPDSKSRMNGNKSGMDRSKHDGK
ncbi:MAG TPA: hypothetical protein VL053_01415 [Arachidicoccus sp.]|nr:hypothetical protein [Arachidicoccus sp.]